MMEVMDFICSLYRQIEVIHNNAGCRLGKERILKGKELLTDGKKNGY